MKTFIRVVEVWVPDATGTLLEWGGGLYDEAPRFGAASRSLCFGRGEGLPGEAWERGRPVVLKRFAGANFRRTRQAAEAGLTCGIALPVFDGERLTAVLVLFCGDDEAHAGAIELWHNDPQDSVDLVLDDGYYGTTAEVFEFVARHTAFRIGIGLPGTVWQRGLPVYLPDLGKGTRFIRAASARQVGINRGFGMPCMGLGDAVWVMTFLSALATPIARRCETWLPDARGRHLQRDEGFCEAQGIVGMAMEAIERGEGCIGRALATGVPQISGEAAAEPGLIGRVAAEAGWAALVALPLWRDGRVRAVVAWYF